jgi:hypothetical protein
MERRDQSRLGGWLLNRSFWWTHESLHLSPRRSLVLDGEPFNTPMGPLMMSRVLFQTNSIVFTKPYHFGSRVSVALILAAPILRLRVTTRRPGAPLRRVRIQGVCNESQRLAVGVRDSRRGRAARTLSAKCGANERCAILNIR